MLDLQNSLHTPSVALQGFSFEDACKPNPAVHFISVGEDNPSPPNTQTEFYPNWKELLKAIIYLACSTMPIWCQQQYLYISLIATPEIKHKNACDNDDMQLLYNFLSYFQFLLLHSSVNTTGICFRGGQASMFYARCSTRCYTLHVLCMMLHDAWSSGWGNGSEGKRTGMYWQLRHVLGTGALGKLLHFNIHLFFLPPFVLFQLQAFAVCKCVWCLTQRRQIKPPRKIHG